jgi:hypothetical protein
MDREDSLARTSPVDKALRNHAGSSSRFWPSARSARFRRRLLRFVE